MFASQILRHLKQELDFCNKTIKTHNPGNIFTVEYRDQIKNLTIKIKNAPQFYLGHFNNMSTLLNKIFPEYTEPFKGPTKSSLRMPYPSFLICYELDLINDDNIIHELNGIKEAIDKYPFKTQKVAIFVDEIESGVYELNMLNHELTSLKWIALPDVIYFTTEDNIYKTDFGKENGERFVLSSSMIKLLEENDTEIPDNLNFAIINNWNKIDNTHIDMIVESKKCGAFVHSFLYLMNTPNIVTETIHKGPQPKKNKRKTASTLHMYKVLMVKTPKKGKKYQYSPGSDRQNRGIMPINWTIGHMKTYTEDAPLFGKHVGSWWWQPTMKGSKQAGFVSKDYCVKQ